MLKEIFKKKSKRHAVKKKLHVKPRFIIICSGLLAAVLLLLVFTGTLFGSVAKTTVLQGTAESSPSLPVPDDTNIENPQVSDTPKPVTPEPSASPTAGQSVMPLQQGMKSPEAEKLQVRLMELEYMEEDLPTDYFGPSTKRSLELFQRKHNLKIDGVYTDEVKNLLFSDQAKKYTVAKGVSGVDVKEIQSRLRELSYLDKSTDYFGDETEAAVKEFQKKNGLEVDGSVGSETKEILFSDKAKAFYYSIGTSGDDVLKLQNRLFELGYLTTAADGKYGVDTENAVKRFQERNGFIADGYLGPQTKALLYSDKADPNALGMGDNGIDIIHIQERLTALNYLKGKADGYFGSNTEGAVKQFQKTNKLKVDGKVGAQTLKVLLSDSAKKATSVSTGSKLSAREKRIQTFIKIAKSKLGARYILGAKGPNTFDCSGFVYWCLNKTGVKQGYMTSAGWAASKKYPRIASMKDLQAGDIISYKGHVGIALGGGKMIDSAPSGGGVRITSLSHPYWQRNFIRGYRVF